MGLLGAQWGCMGTYEVVWVQWGCMGPYGRVWGPIGSQPHRIAQVGSDLKGHWVQLQSDCSALTMGSCGVVWGSVGLHGFLWGCVGCVGPFGAVWGPYGAVGGPVVLFGALWGSMGSSGGCMGPYGHVWGPIGSQPHRIAEVGSDLKSH